MFGVRAAIVKQIEYQNTRVNEKLENSTHGHKHKWNKTAKIDRFRFFSCMFACQSFLNYDNVSLKLQCFVYFILLACHIHRGIAYRTKPKWEFEKYTIFACSRLRLFVFILFVLFLTNHTVAHMHPPLCFFHSNFYSLLVALHFFPLRKITKHRTILTKILEVFFFITIYIRTIKRREKTNSQRIFVQYIFIRVGRIVLTHYSFECIRRDCINLA